MKIEIDIENKLSNKQLSLLLSFLLKAFEKNKLTGQIVVLSSLAEKEFGIRREELELDLDLGSVEKEEGEVKTSPPVDEEFFKLQNIDEKVLSLMRWKEKEGKLTYKGKGIKTTMKPGLVKTHLPDPYMGEQGSASMEMAGSRQFQQSKRVN